MAKIIKKSGADAAEDEELVPTPKKASRAEATPEVDPTPEEVKAAATASLDDSETALVQFAPFEDIDPAPVVGHYNFLDHGHPSILTKHKGIAIPRYVAEHLADRKLGSFIG